MADPMRVRAVENGGVVDVKILMNGSAVNARVGKRMAISKAVCGGIVGAMVGAET